MIKRIFKITQAYMNSLSKNIKSKDNKNHSNRSHEHSTFSNKKKQYNQSESYSNSSNFDTNKQSCNKKNDIPSQVISDLSLFGLTPPSSLDEVKKVRNKEMKKYHPDKFMNSEGKSKTANEIAQIYNDAYKRLVQFFENDN